MRRKSWQWQPGHFLKKARKSLFDSKGTPLSQRSPVLDSSKGQSLKDQKQKEEKKESMVSKKPNALHCLKTLEDYRKDAKLKSTPGLVFKDIPVFRPIEPKKIIDEEIEDIAALAERLHILRLTIAQDSASLDSSLKLSDQIVSENKSMSHLTKRRRGSQVVLGEDWSRLGGEAQIELNGVLQRLKQEERETVLGILQALENELTQRRQQAKNRWLQVRMAVKMGSFRTSKREATPEVESKRETQTTPQVVDVRSTVKPLNLRQCYEAALLAEDQRLGWAKLTTVDKATVKTVESKSEEKETKENKAESEVVLSSVNTDHATLPKELASLRSSLGEWLHLDQGFKKVQVRLSAIRDYCLLVNRLTECTVHLAHDTQLARQILVQFKREPLKDHPALVRSVCQLAASQDSAVIKNLLNILMTSLKEASLLEIPLLEGIAIVLHHAKPEHVSLGHLSALLNLLVERSRNLGSDLAEDEVLELLQAMATVLSSMALISQYRAVQQAGWQKQQLEFKVGKIKDQKYELEPPIPFFERSRQWLQDKQKKALESLDGPQDKSGLAIIQRQDYEKLCQSLNDSIIKAVQSRFDLTAARSQQPELVFALSLIRQALMRLAHREPSRSEKLLEGAQLFFSLVESAKNAVTDFSVQSLLETGNKLMEFINATPLGEKLREKIGSEEDKPQSWFEYYLSLKILIDNDQFLKFEEALIESGQPTSDSGTAPTWNYYLTQSVLQLLERMAQWDSRNPVRQASAQLLILFHHPALWQWSEQTDFAAIKKSSEDRLEKMSFQGDADTHTKRMAKQALKTNQMESQRLLRKARRECQESDLQFQLHDYCVLQLRQAHQDSEEIKNDKRFVPVLAKSSLEAEEDTAELFYPAFHVFLQTRSTAELKTVEVKGDSRVSIPNPKTALLIMGDAGTGKSLFVRRHHLMRCRQYFSHQLEDRQQTSPRSFYLMLNQMPVASPLEYYLDQQGFTEGHIRELQAKGQLIIHLDGYDEWSSDSQYPWVFAPKSFGAWAVPGRNQVIITCRSQYVQGNNQYREAFTPPKKFSSSSYGKELDNGALTEWVITRLDAGGVMRLTQYYVADEQAQGHQPFAVTDYLQQFQSSGIQELVRTPIILLMALQVLPTLRKRHEGNIKVLRLDIYREFIRQYMVAQRQKKLERGSEVRGLFEAAERYAIQLALAFFAEDKAGISYQPPSLYGFGPSRKNHWDTFFAPNQTDTTLSEVVPLRVTTQRNVQEATTITQYSFIHKSMLDYFTARGLYDALAELIGCLTEEPPQPPSLSAFAGKGKEDKYEEQKKPAKVEAILPHLAFALVTSGHSAESGSQLLNLALQWEALQRYAQEKRRWEIDHRKRLLNSPWNTRSINAEQSVIDFIGEILAEEENRWETAHQVQQNVIHEMKATKKIDFSEQKQDEKKIDQLRTKEEISIGINKLPRLQFKQRMISLMRSSKFYPELAQASANAVTVLCRLEMGVFSDLDFSDVRWPGADLVGSYWDKVNLKKADLSKADLRRIWVSDCNFESATLHQVQFGESPTIEAEGEVTFVITNPKNQREIAILVDKKTILIYNWFEHRILFKLNPSSSIKCLSYSPDGLKLASYDGDDVIELWDIQQGKLIRTLTEDSKDTASLSVSFGGLRLKRQVDSFYVPCLSYSPNGLQLAVGRPNQTVQLWDVEQSKLIHTLGKHSEDTTCRDYSDITCLEYSPNGLQLASGSSDGAIKLWDIFEGKLIYILEGPSQLNYISYSPDGLQLASGGGDHTIRLWDIRHGKLSFILELPEDFTTGITGLKYSPDGLQLASSGMDKAIRLWDVRYGRLRHTLEGHSEYIDCLSYSPDGLQLASGGGNTVCLWDVRQGKLSHTLEGHSKKITCLTYSLDGTQLASGSEDRSVRIWDVQQGKLNYSLKGHTEGISSLSYSPESLQLASGSRDKTIRLWDVQRGQSSYILSGYPNSTKFLIYSPDGTKLAVVEGSSPGLAEWYSEDITVQLWDIRQRKLNHTLKGHSRSVTCLNFSPNGMQLASGSNDKTVKVWNVEQGKLKYTLEHSDKVCCLSYLADGLQLTAAGGVRYYKNSQCNTVGIWDMEQGKLKHTLEGHSNGITCLSCSQDGRKLASGGWDGTIRVWDVQQGKLIYNLQGDTKVVRELSFSPDGLQLASGGDNHIELWDIIHGKLKHTLKGHKYEIGYLSYLKNGDQLISASFNDVRLWDTQTGECLQIWRAPSTIACIVWSSNLLFIGGGNGLVAALKQNYKGLFSLLWLQCGRLPILSLTGSNFIDVKGLTGAQTKLIQQRGGKITEITEKETKSEIKQSSARPDPEMGSSLSSPSTSVRASPANTSSSLFGRKALPSNEEKRAKKSIALSSIPAYQDSTFVTHTQVEETPSRPRRYSSPGRL